MSEEATPAIPTEDPVITGIERQGERRSPDEIDSAPVDGREDVATPAANESTLMDEEGPISSADASEDGASSESQVSHRKRRRRRRRRGDAQEQRLLGRRNLCKRVADIAPHMLKTVKMRVLARHLDSKRGMDDDKLTEQLVKDAKRIVGKDQILATLRQMDPDVDRRNLKDIIIHVILLQEETYSLEEKCLEERVLEYEKEIVRQSRDPESFDPQRHDSERSRSCDIYREVLQAAWRNDDVSAEEAELLAALRRRLGISAEDHRLMSASIKRFPKAKCVLHTPDEIHDARKELHREGLVWSYRDENNRNIDVIPMEVAEVLRRNVVQIQLQRTNYIRLLQHDCILLPDLRQILIKHSMDRYGNKGELIERIAESDIQPMEVLDSLDRAKLSDMCRLMGLKSSGNKEDLCRRLIEFYDDLTFEVRESQDEREVWFNNYVSLAARAYADLRAKKLITKDLDVEHQFEKATDYLFEELLNLEIDRARKVTKADGRILMDQRRVLLWDCKSAEGPVNLQDHLDDQFDGYLRREREKGFEPLAILVIGPRFTPASVKLAHQYKARTNWDVALVHADALKHVAEYWDNTNTEQPFPIGLFNRTEVIDMERAEFLISLA